MPAEIGSDHEAGRAAKRVLIAGASGLIGSALARHLAERGHFVVRLVRERQPRLGELAWDPARGDFASGGMAEVDVIVNLSGESIAAGRWTKTRRLAILESRVAATRTLVEAVARAERKPAVLVNASAVGYYGNRGDEVLTEESRSGDGFLAEVCRTWEDEALRGEREGMRVVLTRLGVVLAASGGALGKVRPFFRCGLGGRLGGGRQWMSWVALPDAVRAIEHAIVDPRVQGPINVASPEPVTNQEFTAALAKTLRRPAVLPVPAAVLRLVFGEMAKETMLASTRVVPGKLSTAGFAWLHPTLQPAIEHLLGAGRRVGLMSG